MNDEYAIESLKRKMKALLPAGPIICAAATDECLGDRADDVEWIKEHFDELVEQVQFCAYNKYLAAQRPAAAAALREVLEPHLPPGATHDDFFGLLDTAFGVMDKFFLGLTNGRRTRAGNAFEHVIRVLFKKLSYPNTPQAVINGKTDFLLPSLSHYRQNKMDCIVFTLKRSLRERWSQITIEGTRSPLFLATIDEHVKASDLRKMLLNNIYLVTSERIRAAKYQGTTNVISFKTFFEHYLDPAMIRWRANGIIP